ncbi:hypothetical protein M569_06056, partial [Genlisea aurea]
MAGGGGQSLEETPTWAVAIVCFVLVAISIVIEHILHLIGEWLKKKNKKALYESLEKMKSGGTVMEDDEALAFDLQVQEAIAASLIDSEAVEIEVSGDVLPPEIQREMLEHYHSQHELNTIRLDFKRQIHDRAFANEVNALPDAVWCRTGDHLER